jgi:hypothetical protein
VKTPKIRAATRGRLPGRQRGLRTWLGRTRRTLLAPALALLIVMTGAVTAAHADTGTLDENKLRYQLFVGNERIHVTGNDFWIRGLEQAWLIDYRTSNPGATQQDLVAQLAWFDNQLKSQGGAGDVERPAYAIISGGLQALIDSGKDPLIAGGASVVKQLLDATLGSQVSTFGSVQDQIAGAWQTYGYIQQLNTAMDAVLLKVIQTADSDQTFGAARDAYFGALSKASVYSTAEQFLADPVLSTWINTQSIIDMLQAGQVEQSVILQQMRDQFAALGAKLDNQRDAQLTQLFQNNVTFPPTENGQRGNPSAYATAMAQARANESVLEAARSGVFVLSTIAGFFDPTFGKQINILGSAAVQVAAAINKFLPTVAGLGTAQVLTSLSTVVLTGNILGAVMTLLPLFIDSGPTPEEQILDQVQKLREDVARLGSNMNDRFDRIERGLNTVYQDMMGQFDQMLQLLGNITGQLNQMGHTLVTLQSRLDEMGQRLFAALDDIHQNDLKSQINYALGYQTRYNRPLPETDFIHAENQFEYYADTVSRDAVSTAPIAQYGRVQNADIDPNLAGSELPKNLGYLTWLANQRFGFAIPARAIPNPAVWSLSARAYARLIGENTAVAQTITPQPQVRTTGAEIDALVRQVSQPANGTTNALFTSLITNYKNAAQDMSNALRAEYNGVKNGRNINLFADASQSVPAPANMSTMDSCGGGGTITTPDNMQPAGLPNPVSSAMAGYRAGPGTPQLSNCYSLDVYNTSTSRPNKIGLIFIYGAADMTVQTRFRFADNDPWRVVRTVKARVWSGTLCEDDINSDDGETCWDPVPDIIGAWASTNRAKVQAVAPTVDSTVVNGIASTTTAYLRGEAQRYLATVSAHLTQPTSLRTAAQALTGAATLLRAYARVGFPIALDQDDLMSAMLVGERSIFSETADGPMISGTYQTAQIRFQPCAAGQTSGCTAADKLYQPLWQQPYLTDGLAAPAGVTLPGEPVGDALISAAVARLNVLQERIGVASQQIAAGAYTESLPVYTEVAGRLSLAESLVRHGSAA